MYIKVVNPRLEAGVQKGDIVQAGIVISNSEVGLGSVSVMPLAYRLVCLNGMIVNDLGKRKYHIGRELEESWELFSDETLQADDAAFMLKLADIVRTAVDDAKFAVVIEKLQAAAEVKITAPIPQVVELTSKQYGFSKNEETGILQHLIMGGDGELMLSIPASFAQEESRSISENVKWGVRKRFRSGEIGAANKHLLGYQYDEEQKKYIIIPEEADAVRWMFQMYLDGVSLRCIAEKMNQSGIRSVLGNKFQEASVHQMIFNEVYVGDIQRQKCYVNDPISKAKVTNCGELPQYHMADCHEAIIDRETYTKVQIEMERRAAMVNPSYCFTGKIKCGICGNSFTRKKGVSKGKTYVHWICRSKKEVGETCQSHNYSENQLQKICAELMETEIFNEDDFEESVKILFPFPMEALRCISMAEKKTVGNAAEACKTTKSI